MVPCEETLEMLNQRRRSEHTIMVNQSLVYLEPYPTFRNRRPMYVQSTVIFVTHSFRPKLKIRQ